MPDTQPDTRPDTQLETAPEPSKRRLYGRRMTRPPGQERLDLLETLYPQIKISLPLTFAAPVTQTWMEIGFGSGEHLAALMARHPDYGFIGVEPFINGMSSFLKDIKDMNHDRVRILMDDAIPLAESLPAASIDGLFILNPDPWPKKRHEKRRIINPYNLDVFARILKPGAPLILATDMDFLAEWMRSHTEAHPAFILTNPDDTRTMPADWIETRYQQKGAAKNRRQTYLLFERAP